MNWGITRWKAEPAYPNPFCPVQSSRKLRVVLGTTSSKSLNTIRPEGSAQVVSMMAKGGEGGRCGWLAIFGMIQSEVRRRSAMKEEKRGGESNWQNSDDICFVQKLARHDVLITPHIISQIRARRLARSAPRVSNCLGAFVWAIDRWSMGTACFVLWASVTIRSRQRPITSCHVHR
jgi:hypothetical protein